MTAEILQNLGETVLSTLFDVAPIAAILLGFQVIVLRQRIPNLRGVLIGSIYVVLGLSFFLFGLEHALFPIGKVMATQLTDPAFISAGAADDDLSWDDYYWIYLFAFIGKGIRFLFAD